MDGTELILASVSLLLAALGAVVGYLHYRKRQPTTQIAAPIGSIDSSTTIGSIHVDARAPVMAAPLPPVQTAVHAEETPIPIAVEEPAAQRRDENRQPRVEFVTEVACNEVVDVENASYEVLEFEWGEGDFIKGLAEEKFGQAFNVYVYEEEDYAEFVRTREPTYVIYESEGECSHVIGFEVPTEGTYYVVLDTYGKVNDRTIKLRLKCTKRVQQGGGVAG